MTGARSLVATLFGSYGAGVLASRWLQLHAFAIDGPTAASIVAVPLIQAAILIGWRRLSGGRGRDAHAMSRVIVYWIVFGSIAAVTTYGGGLLTFHRIDLSFLQFAALVSAPLLQATVLAWRETQPAAALIAVARSTIRRPLAQPVLVLDGLMLGAGVVWWDARIIGLGADVNVHSTWTLVKGAAAIAFFGRAVFSASASRRTAMIARAAAPLLLIFALDPTTSWLAAAFARVHARLSAEGEVLQRLAFYGTGFTILIGLTLRAARALRTQSREASAWLHVAVFAAVILAVAVVLATFNLPTVTQPWLGMAALSASVAATSVLLASIFLATAEA